ncbi:hypothetical protein FA95DRAFT_1583363 [Auriscalpium vulgare]|uniref:Uncharacterized protein n=1 Tax=Auriscalpium vulgare TaxID=40419 RepID=A0ACB8RNZ6_9AGAM|nr:hypothetical protein FA95DRAFT_1583363 [Auriscalpium vulgare]
MSSKPRTLVLCFDGTSDEYDDDNTNVVKFYSLLQKDRAQDQLCYYQAGIGTYFQPGVVRPYAHRAAALLDQAFAWYLSAHVLDGYKFLMQNYNSGDKVCLFGFSRGAYTARALAGMLKKVGLLEKDNAEQMTFAYRIYSSTRAVDEALAPGFKKTFCRDVPVEFLGAWDTVASVGLVLARTLPFVSMNSNIKTFRHGLALDEHRVRFIPSLYKGAGNGPEGASEKFFTDAEEVWFVGGHTDVGGGAVKDATPNMLSNVPLRWMVREVTRSKCGIVFDDVEIKALTAGGKPDDLDLLDVTMPIRDELKRFPLWWILEYLPITFLHQDKAGGRVIPPNPTFHTSVKTLLDDPAAKYKPQAQYEKETESFVS